MLHVVIPARLSSSRLPGKLLLKFLDKPLIWHTIQRALESQADSVTVVTEDVEIYDVVNGFKIPRVFAVMGPIAPSGTARIINYIESCDFASTDVIINLQGDEPLLHYSCVDMVFNAVRDTGNICTLAVSCNGDEYGNRNNVKVVCDSEGYAMYFSRESIPHRNPDLALRHVGVYGFTVERLKELKGKTSHYVNENLEQLAWLEHGMKIKVLISALASLSIGIDTQSDFDRLVNYVRKADR